MQGLKQQLVQQYSKGELLQMNWNRISKLSRLRKWRELYTDEKYEMEYRIAVQNEFSGSGVLDTQEFVKPKNPERYLIGGV